MAAAPIAPSVESDAGSCLVATGFPYDRRERVDEYLRFRGGLKGLSRGETRKRLGYVLERCWLTDVGRQIIGHRVGQQAVLDERPLVEEQPQPVADEQFVLPRQLLALAPDRLGTEVAAQVPGMRVIAEIGHAPSDVAIVPNQHGGNSRKRKPRDIQICGLQMNHVPSRRKIPLQVRIVGQQRLA